MFLDAWCAGPRIVSPVAFLEILRNEEWIDSAQDPSSDWARQDARDGQDGMRRKEGDGGLENTCRSEVHAGRGR